MKRLENENRAQCTSADPFWTNGKGVFFFEHPIKGADPQTFEYENCFGRDKKRLYAGDNAFKDGDMESLQVLNFAFAKDKNHIYTSTGRMEGVDVDTFEALDSGRQFLWINYKGEPDFAPHGYARDKSNVFYHTYNALPKRVERADPATFVSLDDGTYGRDADHIFGRGRMMRRAFARTWEKVVDNKSSWYSRDGARVFYADREIIGADCATFEVCAPGWVEYIELQVARDANHFYLHDAHINQQTYYENVQYLNDPHRKKNP